MVKINKKAYCYRSSSVDFFAACDGHVVSSKEVSEALNSLSPEKLKSLFPIEVETPTKTEEQKVKSTPILTQSLYRYTLFVIHFRYSTILINKGSFQKGFSENVYPLFRLHLTTKPIISYVYSYVYEAV